MPKVLIDPDGDWSSPGQLRKEWVETSFGGVWIWELTVAESSDLLQKVMRPQALAEVLGPVDRQELAIWQLVYAARVSDEPGAKRLFEDRHVTRVQNMPFSEYQKLLHAFNRVQGTDDATAEDTKRFFNRGEEDSPSPKPSSVSSTSNGSQKKSTPRNRPSPVG